MKFQPDTTSGVNVISRQEPGRVWVGAVAFTRSVVVPWSGAVFEWDAQDPTALSAAHFERIAALAPEVVLLGSGRRLVFPRPEWLRPLIERRIGIETMDTAAACRTYNILAQEGRSVAVALLLEQPA
jgi:uncharacterized protein